MVELRIHANVALRIIRNWIRWCMNAREGAEKENQQIETISSTNTYARIHTHLSHTFSSHQLRAKVKTLYLCLTFSLVVLLINAKLFKRKCNGKFSYLQYFVFGNCAELSINSVDKVVCSHNINKQFASIVRLGVACRRKFAFNFKRKITSVVSRCWRTAFLLLIVCSRFVPFNSIKFHVMVTIVGISISDNFHWISSQAKPFNCISN